MTAPCKLLEWDTEFFGIRIGRVQAIRLKATDMPAIGEWAADHRIQCLYLLAASDDAPTVQAVENAGFRMMDIRVTLERPIAEAIPEVLLERGCIRNASASDVPALKDIAARVHTDTRFYYDQQFPRERSAALYATWIEKCCGGYSDDVLVAEVGGAAAGYVACHRRPNGVGEIGLIGIRPDAEGLGLGGGLVRSALRWMREHDLVRASVATQGRNVRGQRLYQHGGFVTANVQIWYHKWFT